MNARLRAMMLCLAVGFTASSGFAAETRSGAPLDPIHDIGLFAAKPQAEFCLSIKNPALKPGQEMTLIWTPLEDRLFKPEIRHGRVVEKLTEPCDSFNSGEGDAAYRLDAGKLEPGRIYFAIVGRHNRFMISRGQVRGVVASNELSFRSCTSMEGIHFSIWRGEPLTGTRLWHEYYYLGYDTEPTCKQADFKN